MFVLKKRPGVQYPHDWVYILTFRSSVCDTTRDRRSVIAPAEQCVPVILTYVQLWRQRFLGETEQLRPIYVVSREFVHQSPEAFLHQPRWHILLRPIADQQLQTARSGSPWEGESKQNGQSSMAAAPFWKTAKYPPCKYILESCRLIIDYCPAQIGQ